MQIALRLRRLGPALLAALVLAVSLASATHTHGAATRETAVQADQPAGQLAGQTDLDCALCASAARLAHGAASARLAYLQVLAPILIAPGLAETAPLRVDLDRSEARAPPRLG